MNKKRKIIFLTAAGLFIVSLVWIIIEFVGFARSYYENFSEIGTGSDLYYKFENAEEHISVVFLLIVLPLIASELILLKNYYVLLSKRPFISRQICCILSCAIAFFVILLYVLAKLKFIEFVAYNREFSALTVILPGITLSFLLGLMGKRCQSGDGAAID